MANLIGYTNLEAWELLLLYRGDAKQQVKGKFGNKRPGIPCGQAYISWRKKCSKNKTAIAKDRLKGTGEGKAYADRIRKFKGLEKRAESKGPSIEDQIKQALASRDLKSTQKFRKENRELFNKINSERLEQSRKEARSNRGKKAAATRARNKAKTEERDKELAATPEGKILKQAEAEFAKTVRGNALLDPDGAEKWGLKSQRAGDNLKIANAHRSPSDKQRQYDAQQKPTDLNSGPAPTESWRMKGMNKLVSGNYMGSGEVTGVPWSVKIPTATGQKDVVLAGAEIAPDYMERGKERLMIMHGTQGEKLYSWFPKGDREISRRARRLVNEIGQGKSKKGLPLDAIRGMIESDDYLKESGQKKAARAKESKRESESMDKFIKSKGFDSWADVPERAAAAMVDAWSRQYAKEKA